MRIKKVTVPGMPRLNTFCHAVVAGETIYVSGTLGTRRDFMELVDGGTGPQSTQALRNIERILAACGAGLGDLAKVNVYLADMGKFAEMNEAYRAVMGDDPPARITVGRAELALGAAVEMDGIAYLPGK